MGSMNYPDKEQCLAWFEEYEVPSNIKAHCVKVAQVATFLAKELKKKGMDIDPELVQSLALVHDLFKAVTLPELIPSKQYHPEPFTQEELDMHKKLRGKYPNKWESEIFYEEFKDQFPEFGASLKHLSDPRQQEKDWNQVVVHLADWRITGCEVHLLEERLAYLKERYWKNDEKGELYREVITKDEKRVFDRLDFAPEELKERVEQAEKEA